MCCMSSKQSDWHVLCTTAELKGDQTVEAWGSGAAAGLAAIQRYGGAKPGDRTMLDALTPAVNLFQQSLSDGRCSHKGCTPCDVIKCTCLILSGINMENSCPGPGQRSLLLGIRTQLPFVKMKLILICYILTFYARCFTGSVASALSLAASAASKGAEMTKSMKAGAGRSSYVPEEALHNTADPGASAVSYWLHGVAEAMQ